jgi:hypothetical protein
MGARHRDHSGRKVPHLAELDLAACVPSSQTQPDRTHWNTPKTHKVRPEISHAQEVKDRLYALTSGRVLPGRH